MRKRVLFTAPRRNPLPALCFFGALAAASIAIDIFGVIPSLQKFSQGTPLVRSDSLDVKILGDVFLICLFFSISLAVIRNNLKNQTPEILLLIIGTAFLVMFFIFSTPLLMGWAHIHGYHLDHYEAAHRGGWYVFKLDGT